MASSEPFDVSVASGVTVAAFRPEFSQIDESHIELVSRKMTELVSEMTTSALVLDLTNVEFFGSSFIEATFRTWKRLQARPGARFALCGLKPYCREVLEITHLDTLWTLCDDRKDAVAQLSAPA
jgi:anti-sigma B factor antagonist